MTCERVTVWRKKVVADGTQAANDAEGYFIPPGIDRPFRAVNPMFPDNQAVVGAMNSPQVKNMVNCTGADCSDIVSKLFFTSGNKGRYRGFSFWQGRT